MQAIILAAGMGKRLGAYTENNTKCMVPVNGEPMIKRLLRQLEHLSQPLERIVVVTGYQGANLRQYIETLGASVPVEYVDNPIYDKTNNIYSLYLAKDYLLKDDTLLFESDLIFEDSVIEKILQDPYPNLALVDKFESWMDGTVVTLDDEDNIKAFIPGSKFSWEQSEQYYKTVNIYKFSKEFSATHYVPFLGAYSKALGNNEYYEQVLRVITLLDKPEIKALRLSGECWYEIDDIQDLDIASSIFAEDEETQLKLMESRYGGFWRYPKYKDFCYLVNPYFPDKRMISELTANFETLLREYPSGMRVNSLLAAKYFHVSPEHICVGNGAAELIKALMEQGDVGVTGVIYPTFAEYPNRLQPGQIIPFYTHEQDFRYTAQDLMSFYADKDIDSLLIVNPDNPSGNFIPRADLVELVAWAKTRSCRIIVDESFVDFSVEGADNTLLVDDFLAENPHLFVMKSISKSYGVPGLRLGVLASGNTEAIAALKKQVSIWNINSMGEFYMQIFGKYEKRYVRACAVFCSERDRFMDELRKIPFIRVMPSQANYFICEVLPPHTSRGLAKTLLSQYSLIIKDCSGKKGMGSKSLIRLAVRDEHDNNALISALKQL